MTADTSGAPMRTGMEERDGGTWLRCEWITLSRDLPFGLGLFGTPIVRGVARETSMNTLIAVRTALAKPGPGRLSIGNNQ